MIKCIASDLDGTLLYNGKLSDNNYKAIKMLQENGIEFVIATGRNITEVKMLDFKDLKFSKVLVNGSIVTDENYNILSKITLSMDKIAYVQKIIEREKVGTIFYGPVNRYGFNTNLMFDSFKNSIRDKDVFGNGFLNGLIEIEDVSQIGEDICKCEIMDGIRYDLLESIKEKILNDKLLEPTSSDKNNVEVLSLNTNKYVGLKKLMDIRGYKKEEVAIFGDSDNDFALFENMIESYAMGNGNDNVKKHAKYIVDTCANDGFYKGVLGILDGVKK